MASRQLDPLPTDFVRTRRALHRLADEVVKLAREHVTGEFSLIATPGGFGTPVFGPDEAQVRVEGGELVVRRGEQEDRGPITTLRAAAELCGDLLPDDREFGQEPLEVEPEASRILGEWYAFGDGILTELGAEAGPDDSPTPPTLWPEHFDIAIEMGEEGPGRRTNYGLSPGDEDHVEPYLYVGPWTAKPQGELWNAKGFTGAELDYSKLASAEDARSMALEFCRIRRQALNDMEVEK